MRFLPATLALILAIGGPLRATELPTVKAALPEITTAQGSAPAATDLRNHFEITDILGQVVQFRTSLGNFNAQMLAGAGTATTANFLTYVNGARFSNSIVHRSVTGLGIIQGGGFAITTASPLVVDAIATDPPIALEYTLHNTRGTLAMARTGDPNSATSGWFINTIDNTASFGVGNGGGYAVFARVTGTGMTVVDGIQAVQVYNAGGAFATLPLVGYTSGTIVAANLVVVQAVEAVPIFPAQAGQNAVVTFSATSTNPALVTPTVSASALSFTLAPGEFGLADVTVTATDTNGNAVQNTFRLNVTAGTPEIAVEQPAGSDVADGGNRAFPLVNVGSTADLTFTIKTIANGNVTLIGTSRVAVEGEDADEFSVTAQPASPIAGSGGSTTFTVRFAPTSGGAKSAALRIENDDGDENPFDIALTGTGNARPTLSLPASPVRADPTSESGAVVTFTVTADDAEDGPLIPTVAPASGSTFPIGGTTVNVSATDSRGLQTTGSFTVTVGFQRPASTTMKVGARSGEPAPGAGTGTLPAGTVLSTFGPPAVGDFRELAARAGMLAGRTKLAGICVEDDGGARSLAAYQGGTVPGISTAGVNFKSFLDPVMAPDGAIAFAGTVQGGGVKTTADFGVWTDAFGPALALVLREGSAVPGLPAGARLKAVSSLSLRDGEVLALLTLSAATGVVAAGDDTVLLRMTGASAATLLLREGRELGGFAGSKIKSFSVLSPALGSPGHGRWHGDGAVVAKVVLADGRTLLVKIAATGTVTPLLSTAGAAPPVDPQARWKTFGLPAAGSAGAGFVVAATLVQRLGGVLAGNDTALLFSADGAAWSIFAREGSPAPVTPAGPLYALFFDPLVNDAGRVAFLATLQGAGIKTTNKTALFSGLPGDPRVVARLGDPAPDGAGAATSAVWSKFISHALANGPGAGVIFLAETSGGDTTTKNKLALWAVDSQGTLRRLLRTADALTLGGSPVAGLTLLNVVPGAFGATRSFNATGSIALLATLADKTQAVVRVDVP